MNIVLDKTTVEDLETLFVFQADEQSNMVAAFNVEYPNDKEAYLIKWSRIVQNSAINMRTIRIDGKIVGSVIHFDLGDETNVSYWIDRIHWKKGIASQALKMFLQTSNKKVLHARVAYDNIGSQKVLEKNGFVKTGTEQGFAYGRGKEIEENVYILRRD